MATTIRNFYVLQSAARVLNKEEQLKVVEEAKKRKAELMNACEERKNFMQTMELNRKENEKLSDLEQVEVVLELIIC